MSPAPVTEIHGSSVIEPVEMADSGEIDGCRAFSSFIDINALKAHRSDLSGKSPDQLTYPDHQESQRRNS
jgi:hypothetical protein